MGCRSASTELLLGVLRARNMHTAFLVGGSSGERDDGAVPGGALCRVCLSGKLLGQCRACGRASGGHLPQEGCAV